MGVSNSLNLQGPGILCVVTLVSPQANVIWRGVSNGLEFFCNRPWEGEGGWSKGFIEERGSKVANQALRQEVVKCN
jgi:hypothetical protein